MKIEKFEQALSKDDFEIGDSFWLDGWEFQVASRRNQPSAFNDAVVFKWELTQKEFIHEIKESHPEIKDPVAFFEKHKDEIIHYFGKGYDYLISECGMSYENVIRDAIEEVLQQDCKAAGGRQYEI
jgi:hypothetical protein